VVARLAVLLLPAATLTLLRLELLIELKRQQTCQALPDAQAHVSTAPTVAAIWTTFRCEFFPPERLGPIATVAGFHVNPSAID